MASDIENSRSASESLRSDDVAGRPPKYLHPKVLTLRLDAELLDRLDAETLQVSVEAKHVTPRAEVVQALLIEALDARAKKRKRK